ncbi:MAG: glycosyltransferase, partial [Chloroflexi bacterium]|nr:glycosyltransferase [Chloroflexota bacterium]
MTTVSVIVPAYNHAAFLPRTLESALGQTWQDREIIVVDDGSRDETPAVAARFGQAIRYARQENQGMARTRNNAIRLASGQLISFLDDDDLWLPEYLSTVVERFAADPDLAALHTGYRLTSDQEALDYPRCGTRVVPPDRLHSALLEGGFFPPSSVTVRRSCLENVGVFDESLQGCADWELWLRISAAAKFAGIPDVLMKYRLHAGGLSSNVKHMFDDRLRAISKHCGLDGGPLQSWPEEKRRVVAFAYRSAAHEYSMQSRPEEAWAHFAQAAAIWPPLAGRLDTFYELACGDQPRGYRGTLEGLNLHQNEQEMLPRLNRLFGEASPELRPWRRRAYGNMYLALAMLYDQSGEWPQARRHLIQA